MVLLYDCNGKKIELEAVYLCALSVSLILWLSMMGIIENNWNWTRPQALVQNQQTGELISPRNRGCPSSGVYVPCIYTCQVSYCRQLRSLLLYLCYIFRALINTPVCWFKQKKTAWILWQLPYVVNLGRKFTVRVLFCCCLILVFSAVLIWPALAPCPPPEFLSLLLLFFPLFC